MIQIEGALSVKAALESGNRQITKVLISSDKKSKDVNYIVHLCHKFNVDFEKIAKEDFGKYKPSKTFGGILALTTQREYQSVEELKDFDWCVLIEGIEDPFNLGQMIRTAYASGAQAILLNHRDWSKVESTLLKSSAGAFDRIDIVIMEDIHKDLTYLKKQGFKLISALRNNDSISHEKLAYPSQSILAIGGEMRGLSKTVKELTDISVEIKYPNSTKVALNAVSACAILTFKHVNLV